MYVPHTGEIQQNVVSIAQARNATEHIVFTAEVWHTATRCINRAMKKCNKAQYIYRTRVKYSKMVHQWHKEEMQQVTMYLPHKGEIQQNIASIAEGRNATKDNVYIAKGWNTAKQCFNCTPKKCNKTDVFTAQGWNTPKRCINRRRKKCNKTQYIYRTRVKYSKNLHQSHKDEMH